MNAFKQKRRYALIFILLLALALGSFVYASSAAGAATLDIPSSPASAICAIDGSSAPTAAQDGVVSFSLGGYRANEGIAMYFTFPNGQIRDLPAILAMDGPVNAKNANVVPAPNVDAGGELYFTYQLGQNWPVGCYSIQAIGQDSGNLGVTKLVIEDAKPMPKPTPALKVYKEEGGAVEGQQGDVIAITGAGFPAGASVGISIKMPDGVVNSFPTAPIASASGKFTTIFQFTQTSVTGKYTFTASSPGGPLAADFTLKGPAAPAASKATLTPLVSSDALSPLTHKVEIQGSFFTPLEGVTLWLSLPYSQLGAGASSAMSLPLQHANAQGKFVAIFMLDEHYPSGVYMVTAIGSVSKSTATAPFVIPQVAVAAPPTGGGIATAVPTAKPTTAPTDTPIPTSTPMATNTPTSAPPSATATSTPAPIPPMATSTPAPPTATLALTSTAMLTPTALTTTVPPLVVLTPTPSGSLDAPDVGADPPAADDPADPPEGQSAVVDPTDSSMIIWGK